MLKSKLCHASISQQDDNHLIIGFEILLPVLTIKISASNTMNVKTTAIVFALVLGLGITTGNAYAHHVLKEIPVSISPMKMSMADNYLFVSNLGEREISVIDAKTDSAVRTIVTSSGVVAVEAVPERNTVYAATFESGGIDVYEFDSGKYVKTIELPDSKITVWHSPGDDRQVYLTLVTGGAALDYNPKNGILYVANYNANYIATIDTKTNQVLEKIPVSRHPYALKVDTVSGKVLVASMAGNEVTFLSPQENSGKITHKITSTVKTGTAPWGIDINGIEHLAYVSHRGAHHITVLDILEENIREIVQVGDDTQAIAIDTNEHQVYVSYLQQNKIVKIDGRTNQIVNTIETGALAWDLVVYSESHKIYASMKGEDKVFVMGPRSISATIPVITMQTPIAYVGEIIVHGQDVGVGEATVDTDGKALVISTGTEDGGRLTVSVPRSILDSKDGTADKQFVVYADEAIIGYQSVASDESSRVISVQIPADTETVTISGTTAIPEFGPIAGIILATSIIGTLVAARRRAS